MKKTDRNYETSDSEAVSDFDFKDVGGGQSDSLEDDNIESPEEMYSDQSSHHSDSGESSGSNYESTSSFEARKQKSQKRTSHGSATSKLLQQAGRKRCWKIEQVFLQIHRSQFI